MRRHTILIGGLLAAAACTSPQTANAQFNPLGMMQTLTRPLGAILGGHPRMGSRSHSRGSRSYAHRGTERTRAGRALAAYPQSPSAPVEPAQLGWVGPMVWPSAYEDVLGYVFRPLDYEGRLRAHGHGDILATIFAPSGAYASARPVQLARSTAGSGASETPGAGRVADHATMCEGDPQSQIEWPIERISQGLDLTEPQRDALAQVRSSVIDAVKAIRATCRDEAALAPPERLKAMEDMLWAVRDAALLIREPLKAFYDSLSAEQKARFTIETPAQPASAASSDRDRMQQHMAMAARMCGVPAQRDALGARFERIIQPTAAQRASLEALRKTAEQMGQLLMMSCPLAIPPTPLDRLDMAEGRLTSLIFTTSTISLALNDLYGQLSDRQRARFDTLAMR